MSKAHLTAPDPSERGWPKGIKYIVGNEAAERFSFYGMKAILFVYLAMLIKETGVAGNLADSEAQAQGHIFLAAVYAFPVLGALLADRLVGKYWTILSLSIVYCAGHAAMAIFEGNLEGTYLGLGLIAIGSGGIKPCVSAHVGDQFGKSNWHLVNRVFQVFYFAINFGSLASTLAVPLLNEHFGPGVAFGVPGVLMAIATLLFWMGRHTFVHVPPTPAGRLGFLDSISGFCLFIPIFMLLFGPEVGLSSALIRVAASVGAVALGFALFNYRQRIQQDDGFLAVMFYCLRCKVGRPPRTIGGDDHPTDGHEIADHWFFGPACKKFGSEAAEGPLAVLRIVSVFFLVSVFWMLFDQHSTTWVRQAQDMDLSLGILDVELLPSQISAANPALVMVLIPFLMFVVFPWLQKRGVKITPLGKMSAGMFLTAVAFLGVGLVQVMIEEQGPGQVSFYWQGINYLILTAGEVLVSVTGLEFAYTQAPKRMKSVVMSFWLLCVAFGNWFAALLSKEMASLDLSYFFFVCCGTMAAAAVLFTFLSRFYRYKEYSQ